MGFKDFMRRRANEWSDAKADFELGCQILGQPSDPRSVLQRKERMDAGRRERERRARLFGEAVVRDLLRRAHREAQAQKGRDVQFEQDGVKVKVRNGYSRDYDSFTTDVILVDPGRPGVHLHLVIDENGQEIHRRWTEEH